MNRSIARATTTRITAAVGAMATACAIAVVGATGAQAASPQPVHDDVVGAPGEFCAFAEALHYEGKIKVIDLPGGRTIVTSPGLTVTATNLATGKSVSLSITGPGFDAPRADGLIDVTLNGRNLMSGEGSTQLLVGRTTLVLDPTTGLAVAPPTPPARVVDVCALIA